MRYLKQDIKLTLIQILPSPPLNTHFGNPVSELFFQFRLHDHKQESTKLMTLQTAPYGPLLELMKLWNFLVNYYIFPLSSQREDFIGTRACRGGLGKTGRSQKRVKILSGRSSSESLCVVLSQERKMKFHAMPSFPNPDPLLNDPFSPCDNYCLFAHLVLHPNNWALLSACLGHSGYWFFWMSLKVAVDLGKVVSFAPSFEIPFIPKGYYSILPNIFSVFPGWTLTRY